MSEELKDEAICLAHSSIKCSKKCIYSYETTRGCKLGVEVDGPYTSGCAWRHVIIAPLPEIPKIEPITILPVQVTSITDDLPF